MEKKDGIDLSTLKPSRGVGSLAGSRESASGRAKRRNTALIGFGGCSGP